MAKANRPHPPKRIELFGRAFHIPDMKKQPAINELLRIMARLRSPTGCPWDREQDHRSLRWHAVEEVYELMDAIEAGDDAEIEEELGDVLLQVVFHCQLARERGAFDFEKVARRIADKLIRRHPHVFGSVKVRDVDQVWANWEKIKRAEKQGTRAARPSALDGVPKHLPALLRAEKLLKKARRAKLMPEAAPNKKLNPASRAAVRSPGFSRSGSAPRELNRARLASALFDLAREAHIRGWSAEDLLLAETRRRERVWRKIERQKAPS
jgi:NTP pyrophosphatase (non-canonical NTP hydrolase)